MAVKFELNRKTLQFVLHAIVERKYMHKSQAEILSLIIDSAGKTKIGYLKSIKKNQKLVGTDRVELIENLDFLIIYLLLFLKSLNENNELFSIENLNLHITKRDNHFEIMGSITPDEYDLVTNFNESFNKFAGKNIEELIGYYKTILRKGNQNIKVIYDKIESLILHILTLRTKLEDCQIDL
ncbi:MAG: hypothetical protein U9N32_00205 [Spirochaetota bacterium]|nr:hypothetical protein [Spirochaetota bacterium]